MSILATNTVERCVALLVAISLAIGTNGTSCRVHAVDRAYADDPLPPGAKVVWELDRSHREATSTRERICINGLWRWQPADREHERVPVENWGYFKVPGCWPGITDYMQKDCQTVHAHRSWQDANRASLAAAWYQREITIPATWTKRRIAVETEYLNSYAAVYVDGNRVGEIRFPAGELDLTTVCHPGEKHVLSLLVVAMPLQGVMLSYNDSNASRQVKGSVARRGLCGDVYLVATPADARLGTVKVDTSVCDGEITFESTLLNLSAETQYTLRAEVSEDGRGVREFTSKRFRTSDVDGDRVAFTERWQPEKLWDIHSPENQYDVTVSLLDANGKVLDTSLPTRFGFREFRIDGRDFYLNGSRIFLCAVPLDNAQVGAAWATYEGALESLKRLQSFGVNAVYSHNYGCQPGSHLSFAEILQAADDVGMLVSLSQPHFSHYDWNAADADETNGYLHHAKFYTEVAGNHPSVVMYSMSHNATGYSEDMNPNLIDGIHDARTEWSLRNVRRALRAEAIVTALDPERIVYHHSSGNLSSMHTSNFYPNWVPIQEMSDWFEHWATSGVKPFFTCEYGAPFMWDWAMYRGWYKGERNFGSAAVPWDFCLAEWNAQFLGDRAFRISAEEQTNLRWEARQFRAGNVWHRWDYPHQLGSSDFDERYPVLAAYLVDNWRAFRTWGVSAISPWEHRVFWKLRADVDRNRRVELPTDWDHLQRPGFSPDYLEDRYERMDLAYEPGDWVTTLAAEAMYRNNRPLLAYIAGKPDRFTSKDHNFLPGETVEKQIVVINNSRQTVTAQCAWSADLPQTPTGNKRITVATGQQQRIPLAFHLPVDLQPGRYSLQASIQFDTGQGQEDQFAIHVLSPPAEDPQIGSHDVAEVAAKIALFDPRDETRKLLAAMGVRCQTIECNADLSQYDLLIIGQAAMTPEGPMPDITRVRDGLNVIVFEQTAQALEQRLGFRVQEYGLRNVFTRVADHPYLAGLDDEHLRDWRGASTILPPRLDYQPSEKYNGVPVVKWCGLDVPRLWRCGNRGNVASVLIEKPAMGNFLPIIDGGFSLQYSPLLEYREGQGMVLFCQMDVTGRTEQDPAARRLVRNILSHVSKTSDPVPPTREAFYVGDSAGKRHLEHTGFSPGSYQGGKLSPDQVLIVGRGGGQSLAEHLPAVAQWLEAGGHLLAIQLDAAEANTFLPTPIRTVQQEHIAAFFDPPSIRSPFAGVGPADVHNRDPRKLPLVSGGATVMGGGVLAQATDANIVFCQLAPYHLIKSPKDAPRITGRDEDAMQGEQNAPLTPGTEQQNQRKTFRRSSFLLTRLLANMNVGSQTPLLTRFATPIGGRRKDSIIKNGDLHMAPHDPPSQDRWASGLYVDTPQEWDDPYRFFRW